MANKLTTKKRATKKVAKKRAAKKRATKKRVYKKRATKKVAKKKRTVENWHERYRAEMQRTPKALEAASNRKRKPIGTRGLRPGPIGKKADRQKVQLTFLEAYAELGTILRACDAANVSRQTHYNWLELDESYAIAFEAAMEMATDLLEHEARRRALEGIEEPVGWYKGEPGGYVTKYSDGLLKFLLEGRRSAIFKNRHELTGAGGGPIAITEIKRVIVDPKPVEDDS